MAGSVVRSVATWPLDHDASEEGGPARMLVDEGALGRLAAASGTSGVRPPSTPGPGPGVGLEGSTGGVAGSGTVRILWVLKGSFIALAGKPKTRG
jgi:hypothetical protein